MKNRLMMCAVGILVGTCLVACSDPADANDGNNSKDKADVGVESKDVATTDVKKDIGVDTSTDGDDNVSIEDSGTKEDTETGGSDEPAGALSGVWAQKTVMSSLTKIPIFGSATTTTETIQKLVIRGESPNYTVHSTPCTVELKSSSSFVETVVPDAFVRSLATTERSLTTNGTSFVMPKFWEARGVRLTNVETDALPVDKTDARIFDQDGDGKPGMTIRLTKPIDGEIYVIQRGSTQFTGQLSNDRLDGLIVWTDEQVVLGSDNDILASNQPENSIDPKPENSFFRSTKLSSDLSCEAIVGQAATLFAR